MRRRTLFALGLLAPWLQARAQPPAPSAPQNAARHPSEATQPDAAPPALELAGTWRPGLPLRDWWVSEKYDGIRAWWDGHALHTRRGHRIAAPAWFTAGWPRVPLDGELWAGRGAFALAQSTIARQQASDDAWRKLRFMAFDMPAHGGNFDARLAALKATLAKVGNPALQLAPQRRVASDAALQALLRATVKGGGEGLMLRRGSAPYTPGRSDNLLKLKDHDDAEARVVGHIPGKGRHASRLGALLVETPEGKRFRLGTGLTDAQRDSPPPIGSWVTYRYRGLHPASGLPRFASFVRVREEGL